MEDPRMELTCITCQVTFNDPMLHREHYKGDWHRYNLKRKVAGLAPVEHEAFSQIEAKQKQLQSQLAASTGKGSNLLLSNTENLSCDVCRKPFGAQKAYESHLRSKKHLERVKNQKIYERLAAEKKEHAERIKRESQSDSGSGSGNGSSQNDKDDDKDDDSDWESIDSDDEIEEGDEDELLGEPIPTSVCLFCCHISNDFEENLKHMAADHSFFIPDAEYVVDVEGLISYLGEKVGGWLRCLWCGEKGRQFYSLDAVQKHMNDLGHTKMRFDPANVVLEYADFFDYSSSYPDAEPGKSKDEEIQIRILEASNDWQLTLPSGAVIGHRSLARYFKQRLRPINPEEEERRMRAIQYRKQMRPGLLSSLLGQYRSLGWRGTARSVAAQRAKDVRYMQSWNARQSLKVGQQNNATKQMHFRSQILF